MQRVWAYNLFLCDEWTDCNGVKFALMEMVKPIVACNSSSGDGTATGVTSLFLNCSRNWYAYKTRANPPKVAMHQNVCSVYCLLDTSSWFWHRISQFRSYLPSLWTDFDGKKCVRIWKAARIWKYFHFRDFNHSHDSVVRRVKLQKLVICGNICHNCISPIN